MTRLLFEPESQQVPEQIDEIHNCQAMWRIKEKISLENLRQKLCNENTKQLNIPPEQCPLAVLNLFLQEVSVHYAVKCYKQYPLTVLNLFLQEVKML